MLNSEKLKSEIDKIPKEYYENVFDLLKSITNYDKYKYLRTSKNNNFEKDKWVKFISQTYGSLSAFPIERGTQGGYESHEEII